MTTNVFWPAWEWGPRELGHFRYISFSHEQNLATRDNVRCRNLINSEWYQKHWGDQFDFAGDQNAKIYYENTKTGWRQACAADSMTGRRGDRVIGDDPHTVKGAESDAKRNDMLQTFSETIPSRLNKQAESAIVVIMQRVHEEDVSGLILANELGYEHLMLPMEFESERRCYSTVPPSYMPAVKETTFYHADTHTWELEPPMDLEDPEAVIRTEQRYNVDPRKEDGELIDPERFPADSVEELKNALASFDGAYAEAGQLQQRPSPRGGGMFKRDDFNFIERHELAGLTGRKVRGYDLAASEGKNAAATASVKGFVDQYGRVIIEDVREIRKEAENVKAHMLTIARMDGVETEVDIPQDPGQAGKTQVVDLVKNLAGFVTKYSTESGDKTLRAQPLASQVEIGNVYLVKGKWNKKFVDQAATFPNGKFKDMIDAASRMYSNLIRTRVRKVSGGPKVFENG
jgi:predicted phage terminase large subunit-like protein